jgi:hypothetical protein
MFDEVQKLLKKRGAPPERSDAYLIQGMRKVLAREGKLTHRILKKRGILGCAYYKRFGFRHEGLRNGRVPTATQDSKAERCANEAEVFA